MKRKPELIRVAFAPCVIAVAMGFVVVPCSAYATGEIQVYNAEIAEVGQWTIQQHLNYTFLGPTVPTFPGGLVPFRRQNLRMASRTGGSSAFMHRSPSATWANSFRTDSKFA